ncbi:MAG: hypothetical protein IT483_06945 [Gammaproteobacteria bacterium]|mgnify:CR=1 FL=1|nr:hypothetical protein [Gammaproteobacteria bacterium]
MITPVRATAVLHAAVVRFHLQRGMRDTEQQQADAAGNGVKIPSVAELEEITRYLSEHSAEPQSSR